MAKVIFPFIPIRVRCVWTFLLIQKSFGQMNQDDAKHILENPTVMRNLIGVQLMESFKVPPVGIQRMADAKSSSEFAENRNC